MPDHVNGTDQADGPPEFGPQFGCPSVGPGQSLQGAGHQRLDGGRRMPVVGARGQHQDRRRGPRHDLLDRVLALTAAQVKVEDDDVGPGLGDLFDRLRGVVPLVDDDDVTLVVQDLDQTAALRRRLVDDEHPNGRGH